MSKICEVTILYHVTLERFCHIIGTLPISPNKNILSHILPWQDHNNLLWKDHNNLPLQDQNVRTQQSPLTRSPCQNTISFNKITLLEDNFP